MFSLSKRSEKNLKGVHPDLVRVVRRAIELTDVDFAVTQGLRTREEQARLVAGGKSQTMKSRHLTGHAVDVVALIGGAASWEHADYAPIAHAFKRAAAELRIPIVWGGDWVSFVDMPHFELDRRVYQADER